MQANYFNADRLEHLVNPHSPGSGMLAIIDPAIERASDLAAGALPGASVLVLDSSRDGIAQISDFLRHHSGYTSLHLIGHGAPGCLYLGNTHLTLNNLHRYAAHFQQWTAALGQGFDLLLYGCEVAQGPLGRAFVQHLACLAQAQILASTTPTGHATLGGDWRLDYATHPDRAQRPALTPSAMAAYPAILEGRVVNNVSELITAINDFNANGAGADRILLNATTFQIGSVHTIDPVYGPIGLPAITTDISIVLNTGIANATIERTGAAPYRLFLVTTTGTLTLDGDGGGFDPNNGDRDNPKLTIRNGFADGTQSVADDGGALVNAGGTVNIDNVAFRDNRASDDSGAIINLGLNEPGGNAVMTIYDSLFTNNEALTDSGLDDGGGAIENDGNRDGVEGGASLTINNTSITGNRTNNGTGGGIRSRDGSTLVIQNSSITNNQAASGGGIALVASPGVPAGTTSLAIGGTTVTGNTGSDVIDAAPGAEGTTAITNSGGNTVGTTNAPELSPSPIIEVTVGGASIPDGQTSAISLGSVFAGDTAPPTQIRIKNIGSPTAGNLTFDSVTLVGADSSRFTLTPPAQTTLTSGQETIFTLAYTTSQVGTINSTVRINNTNASNVSADKIYDFAVQGEVKSSAPGIKVELLDSGSNSLGEIADNRTTPIPLGNVVQGNPVQPTTFRITNTGNQPLNLGAVGFTGSDGSRFSVSTPFTTPLAPAATTTFAITYNAAAPAGTFNGTVNFTTNATNNPDGTFNFAVQGTANTGQPTIVVTKIGGIPETATDGSTAPILLGDTALSTPKTVTFEVRNAGSSDLNLATPTATGEDAARFTIGNFDLNPFPTTLAAGATAKFGVTFQGAQQDNLDARIQIGNVNDATISADKIFDFAIQGTVGGGLPQPSVATNRLTFDTSNRLFALGDLSAGGSNLVLKLANAKSSKILDVRVSKVNANKQTVEVLDPLSILPDGFRPNGFGSGAQSSMFSFSNVTAGDRFTLSVQTIDGQTISLDSSQVQVRDLGGGQWSINFSDSSFGSVELLLNQTSSRDVLGAGPNQRQGLEILDLSGLSGGNVSFTVYREAAFNNFVGFYRIDDLSGTVGGVTPGSSGYAQAALNARVSSISLSVGNQGIASSSASLGGNAFYAPFILVDADINQFLEENPNNQGGDGPQAYFIFASANPDGVDHIRLLGDNTFGFEDLPGGGDLDFNDLIVTVNIA